MTTQERVAPHPIFQGVIGSLIAAALIGSGLWLAEVRAPQNVELLITLNEVDAGELKTWRIDLTNASNYAQDVELKLPKVEVQYASVGGKVQSGEAWDVELRIGDSLQVLLVLVGVNETLTYGLAKSLISAKYLKRNETTGTLEPFAVPLRVASEPPVSRIALQVFWFILPFLSVGVALVIVRLLLNRLQVRKDVAGEDVGTEPGEG